MIYRTCFVFLCVLFVGGLYGQEKKIFDPVSTPIEEVLPKLSVLLDTASSNSPLLKIKDSDILIQRLNEISIKRKWLEFATIDGQAAYGKYDALTSGNLNTYTTVTTSNQLRFSLGFTIRIPLYSIFTLKLNNRIASEETRKAFYEYEKTKQEVRGLVIRQYNDLVLAQKVLRLKSDDVQSLGLLFTHGEKQFANGDISLDDITKLRQSVSKAKEEFESARNVFIVTYLLLQETVGIQFNLF